MTFLHTLKMAPALLLIGLFAGAPLVLADDKQDLTTMLHAFLAEVTKAETHNGFWANDLIYTSSRGTRTTKAKIMAGFSESYEIESEEPGTIYTAEDIQIQVYGDAAIVAFRLVATPSKDSEAPEVQSYLNTGTFMRRDGVWQVVAWQATMILGAENE